MRDFILAVIGFIIIILMLAAILALPKTLKAKQGSDYIYVYYKIENGKRKKYEIKFESFWQVYWRCWVKVLAGFVNMTIPL
ncbi:hypothetical protein [Lactobacillus sp. LL6]|uniref:hypothetical protein n=1 Tax=Lactobacillus sp. LL6 TaxID=2596827 RepID=UPI0011849494|nr:hypothetical protein [Lactobacillus sp. LL6]TSO26894.1 hypothetical protein FOD82_07695 [Lactobacillus sp. LL6]